MLSTLLVSRIGSLCAHTSRAPGVFSDARFAAKWIGTRFMSESRSYTRRRVRRLTPSLVSDSAAATETAFNAGKGLVAGAAVVGIGALCYYGSGMSDQTGIIDNAMAWPQYVRERVKASYMYFGGSVAFTALSATAIYRSPALMSLVTRNSWMAIGASFAAMIGSGMLVRSLPYEPGVGAKQAAWLLHCAVMGAMVAPLALLGGPIVLRAAWYTTGVVGGLSAIAITAPSEKFLNMTAPLAIGLGVVFCASIGTMFLPPTTAMGASLYSLSIYGGLVLFSMFLLYDTQRLIKKAEMYPTYSSHQFDPINASISIYMDTLNIFIRLAMILAGNGGNRRK